MKTVVSVIIPVYKVEQFIDRCVQSVFSQTYENLEIILVDDGSPDNCPNLCDEYAAIDNRVKVIHKENGGLSDARNAGLKIANGTYVFFLDSDDFIHEKTIEYLVELACKHSAQLVQCDRALGTGSTFVEDPFLSMDDIEVYDNKSIFESPKSNVSIWAKLYLRKLWDGVEMPIGKLNEDDYTTWKLYFRATKIVVSRYKLYYNFVNPDGICANLKKRPKIEYPIEAYRERVKFFEDHNESKLCELSKWCYIKCIIVLLGNTNLSKEQYDILLSEFNYCSANVFKKSTLSLEKRMVIFMFKNFPRFTISIVRYIKKKKINNKSK